MESVNINILSHLRLLSNYLNILWIIIPRQQELVDQNSDSKDTPIDIN